MIDMDLKRQILQACWQGLVRLFILQEARKGPIYGVRLKKLLARQGYAISSGSLYPMLHQLEEGGALRSRIRIFRGRARKYYDLTPLGLKLLLDIKAALPPCLSGLPEETAPAPEAGLVNLD
jgi:DNA-binding PadR family transcriptional regulator